MPVERTVTITLPNNIDEFLCAYAKLLKYPSVEAFLKEEIQWLFDAEHVNGRFDIYFGTDMLEEIVKRYGLTEARVQVEP